MNACTRFVTKHGEGEVIWAESMEDNVHMHYIFFVQMSVLVGFARY